MSLFVISDTILTYYKSERSGKYYSSPTLEYYKKIDLHDFNSDWFLIFPPNNFDQPPHNISIFIPHKETVLDLNEKFKNILYSGGSLDPYQILEYKVEQAVPIHQIILESDNFKILRKYIKEEDTSNQSFQFDRSIQFIADGYAPFYQESEQFEKMRKNSSSEAPPEFFKNSEYNAYIDDMRDWKCYLNPRYRGILEVEESDEVYQRLIKEGVV